MNSSLFDIVIGIVLVYLTFSLVCTLITEWWARIRLARPKQLKRFVEDLFGNDAHAGDFAARLFTHPLILGLWTERMNFGRSGMRRRFPSYIPPKIFALAMLDLAFVPCRDGEVTQAPAAQTGLKLKAPLTEEGGELPMNLHILLHALTNCTRGSCQHTQERIERWFIDSMQRLTGQYTRYAHSVTLTAAVIVTLLCNVDTVWLARTLRENPAKAQAAVTLAQKVSANQANPSGNPAEAQKMIAPALAQLDLPLGWPDGAWVAAATRSSTPAGYLFRYYGGKLTGWVLTIFAISLGAPFWFDLLNRIVRLRQAGAN